MGGLAGCRGGGGHLSLVVLVSEKPNSISEKSAKFQGILFICGAGNPGKYILWFVCEKPRKKCIPLSPIHTFLNLCTMFVPLSGIHF